MVFVILKLGRVDTGVYVITVYSAEKRPKPRTVTASPVIVRQAMRERSTKGTLLPFCYHDPRREPPNEATTAEKNPRPSEGRRTSRSTIRVFKTGAFNHSATPPGGDIARNRVFY